MMGMSKRKNIFINSAVTDDDASLCLCLSPAGSSFCRFPSHCEIHFAKKRKLALQGNNICNAAAVVPVARRPRNWGYSIIATALL
ncbi:hypothetical protein A2U01_0068961, partial [Trifolium medium]|nr:hypothetical protein [Trifolium medium]